MKAAERPFKHMQTRAELQWVQKKGKDTFIKHWQCSQILLWTCFLELDIMILIL